VEHFQVKRIEEIYESTVVERDEHRKSKEYKKLSPRMKDAVDFIFGKMDSKPSDFLNSFEKTIKDAAKQFKVKENELMSYFEKEMLSI
jgi:K+/H+ antiporter YhaU regulatory subunit KhtT